MAWGNDQKPNGAGICHACHRTKEGTKKGMVSGGGFGSERKKGITAVCINPECKEGQKNLAKQSPAS